MGLLSTIKREYRYISDLLRMLSYVKDVDPNSERLLPDDIENSVDEFGPNLAFIEDARIWTYDAFDAYANQVAHWAVDAGLTRGDCVAIFVRNRLEYVALWYGLTKVGIIPALLNYQLASKALQHCVTISEAKYLIVDHEMSEAYFGAKADIADSIIALSAFGPVKGLDSFDAMIAAQSAERPDRKYRAGIKAGEQLLKMFTSGTTGLPKAAKVSHVRGQNYMRGFAAGAKCGPEDRMMMVLPMYHATGGLCGVGCALMKGGAVIVRPKFSASKFWEECTEYGATLFMYVGELCRFLLSAPPHPMERSHNIRFIIGNGLRPEVWPGFVSRFNIPNVIEFYGATEGNVSLINVRGRVGAIGRVPGYLKHKFNIDVIEYDVDSGRNVRGRDGLAVRTKPGVVGEMIGEIKEDEARFRFDGYENRAATEKKILRGVFKPGDKWFRTGDLVRRDKDGYFYFVDRVGDTYRWKAENVATNEVAGVLSGFPGIVQANVYGVAVPGHDGRAGMASIVTDKDIDLAALYAHVTAELPHYARPVFLRLQQETDTTSTFKFKKTDLVKAGFDHAKISDPLYYAPPRGDTYEPLSAQTVTDIENGEVRL
ncbi:long-chain-acyl-CoA synthetase [Robiginitomaculum antarcticum]|uniref:long-chain-acyl-CoA synthetase n=1 Tax=Robiginitomaculum antarcticum TaxID=437507 RepID=UPI00036B2AC1|nr:long-chain-acyl-CoA synthetase [Robiginitomaculum antarcticum]